MTIRLATRNDLNLIEYIIKDSIPDNSNNYNKSQLEKISEPDYKILNHMIKTPETELYILMKENKHTGFLSINMEHSIISGLYIRSGCKHNGFGTRLLKFAEKRSREYHSGVVVYSSLDAVNFYNKRSYETLGLIDAESDCESIPLKIMKKQFDDSFEVPRVCKQKLENTSSK